MQHFTRFPRAKSALAGFTAMVLAVSLSVPSLAFAEPSAAEKQAEAQTALASLNAMQDKLNTVSATYDEAMATKAEAEESRDAAQTRVDEANEEIADLQSRLGTRARSMYRSGNMSFLEVLVGSATFGAFASNWDLLTQINEGDAELVQQTKNLREEVQQQKAVYVEQSRVAQEKADEAKRMKDETAVTMSAMQSTYNSLSAEATELLAQERAAQTAKDAANAQAVVDQSIADASKPNPNPNPGPNPSPSPSPAPAPPYNPSTGNAVVDRAYSQIGKDYGYGDPSYGAGPTAFDCSGLVAYCLTGSYSRMGSTATFMAWPTVSDPLPGDVAVSSGHAGIYIGGNMMIHAATYGVGVVRGPVQGGMKIVRPPW